MAIYIPQQEAPNRDSFPVKPRKIKRWLKDLPLVNMGETTREFYNGLRQLNRLRIPIKTRLAIMELIHPSFCTILEHLHKHLVSRSLPLPAKSQKIINLTQTLVLEMANGYKACVHPVAAGDERLDNKRLTLAIHRSLRLLGQALLQSAQVYANDPDEIWADIHPLYALAETRRLLTRTVKDSMAYERAQSTIPDIYKQLCLLALSRPQTLRQGEAEKLAAYFERMSGACELGLNFAPDASNGVYVCNLAENEPPLYVSLSDIPDSADIRTINLTAIVRDIRDTMQTGDFDATSSIINRSELGFDLMRRLLLNLASTAKRRFSRAQKDDVITVAVGINNIHKAIRDDVESLFKDEPQKAPQLRFDELSLQTIRDEERSDRQHRFNPLATDIWDIVARGNLLSHRSEQRPPSDACGKPSLPETWETWRVSNASAGGYGLCWKAGNASRAQVGELIGLREREGNTYQWRLGMVRWMQFEEEHGLEIGIQLLAPKTLLVSVEEFLNRSTSVKTPCKAFMLPGIKTIQLPPSIIAPAHQFEIGDVLHIKLLGRSQQIILTEIGEHTSAFAQFHYTTNKEKPPEEPKEQFDTLWPKL